MKTLTITAAVAAVALFVDKATSDNMCPHVVIDGIYNLMAQQWGSVSGLYLYREINPVSGAWGDKVMLLATTNYFLLYDQFNDLNKGSSWRMQFAYQHKFPSVCTLDNWNRAYQGWNLPWAPYNDAHLAILSGTNAAANCIPFPGTIDGEKIQVTSPVVYGVGDCAQAVSKQYPKATGVQVDPWGGQWSTQCYAVFGHTKTDQPNDNNAHRACFFRDAVRPGGLARGTSLGIEFGNVEECVEAVKAHAGAQDAKAIGATFDRSSKECLYHDATELAATKFGGKKLTAADLNAYEDQTQEHTQVHVLFSHPLSRRTKCCRRCRNKKL